MILGAVLKYIVKNLCQIGINTLTIIANYTSDFGLITNKRRNEITVDRCVS
jgi:hypothetical protein